MQRNCRLGKCSSQLCGFMIRQFKVIFKTSLIFMHIRKFVVSFYGYRHSYLQMLVSNPTISKQLPPAMSFCNPKNNTNRMFLYKKGLMHILFTILFTSTHFYSLLYQSNAPYFKRERKMEKGKLSIFPKSILYSGCDFLNVFNMKQTLLNFFIKSTIC